MDQPNGTNQPTAQPYDDTFNNNVTTLPPSSTKPTPPYQQQPMTSGNVGTINNNNNNGPNGYNNYNNPLAIQPVAKTQGNPYGGSSTKPRGPRNMDGE